MLLIIIICISDDLYPGLWMACKSEPHVTDGFGKFSNCHGHLLSRMFVAVSNSVTISLNSFHYFIQV